MSSPANLSDLASAVHFMPDIDTVKPFDLKKRSRPEIFHGKLYLHWFNPDTEAFTTFKEEADRDFVGLVFPGEPMCDEYVSCGWRLWQSRSVHDAPDWVVSVKLNKEARGKLL